MNQINLFGTALGLLLFLLAALTAPLPRPTVAPPPPGPCTMDNGQPRPYPCEFQIVAMYLLGKNNELLATLKPGSTTVSVPKSKAMSTTKYTSGGGGQIFTYAVSLDFRRINTPSFTPKPTLVLSKLGFYQIGTARVDYPLTSGEITTINYMNVGPTLPPPGIRPNRTGFTLQLNYPTNGGGAQAPVKYVQIANPITFSKFPSSVIYCGDRAEAFIKFNVSVNLSQ